MDLEEILFCFPLCLRFKSYIYIGDCHAPRRNSVLFYIMCLRFKLYIYIYIYGIVMGLGEILFCFTLCV